MGDYFPDDTPEKKEAKSEELIEDFETLYSAYDMLIEKVNLTMTQGYETIIPIRHELRGSGNSPDDIGLVGEIRNALKSTRLFRIQLGQNMWRLAVSVEDLDNWSDRYSSYLEKHIDAFKVICRSAFAQLNNLYKKSEDDEQQILELQKQIASISTMNFKSPEKIPEKKIKEDLTLFSRELKSRISDFKKAYDLNDDVSIELARKYLFSLPIKSQAAKDMFDEAYMSVMQKVAAKKNEAPADEVVPDEEIKIGDDASIYDKI